MSFVCLALVLIVNIIALLDILYLFLQGSGSGLEKDAFFLYIEEVTLKALQPPLVRFVVRCLSAPDTGLYSFELSNYKSRGNLIGEHNLESPLAMFVNKIVSTFIVEKLK